MSEPDVLIPPRGASPVSKTSVHLSRCVSTPLRNKNMSSKGKKTWQEIGLQNSFLPLQEGFLFLLTSGAKTETKKAKL